jgi:hypothetical protein
MGLCRVLHNPKHGNSKFLQNSVHQTMVLAQLTVPKQPELPCPIQDSHLQLLPLVVFFSDSEYDYTYGRYKSDHYSLALYPNLKN